MQQGASQFSSNLQHPDALRSECPDEHLRFSNELPVTSIKMILAKFGFACGGRGRTKTGHNETKNKKAKYDAYKDRQNEYEKHRVSILSTAVDWSNEFSWVHRDD